MTQETKPKRPKIETWGQRVAWLGRMPLKWRVLFGTQAVIFGMAIRFRFKDLGRASLKMEEEKEKEESTESSS
jgi:hypothetical protein